MSRRKYRLPPPPPLTAFPSPAEIIELEPRSGRTPVTPVTPLPGSPAPEIVVLYPRGRSGSIAPLPVALDQASAEADGVNIIVLTPAPRRWLCVTLALPTSADPASSALAVAWFVTRMRAADKRLRLTLDRQRSGATANELSLVFAPLRGGSLAAEWLEEVKPVVRESAAEFEGAELRAVEVISEE